MKAQQAPDAARHSCEVAAVKLAPINAHSMNGGTVIRISHTASIVSTVFSGEENNRSRTQAIGPVVERGGGRDSVTLAISALHQGDVLVVPVHEDRNRNADRQIDRHDDQNA